MKTLLSAICVLIFTIPAFAADYKDFSVMNESPLSFEYELDIDSLFPGSLIIFERGYPELWEATDVRAVHMQGEIKALIQGGIAHLANNACGGFVAPAGTDNVFYKDNLLVVSANDYNYFYYLSECARYRQGARYGSLIAVVDPLVCEADAQSRTITNAHSGRMLYHDEPKQMSVAIYADEGACYFMDADGTIDRFDGKEMSYVSYVDSLVRATPTDAGFSGFSGTDYFNVTVMQTGILLEFMELPSDGNCFLADGSRSVFCEAYFEESFSEKANAAESVMIGEENIYTLTRGILSAYSGKADWIKSFMVSYKEPSVCSDNAGLYFTGVKGEVYHFEPDSRLPQEIEALPENCTPGGFYRDGAIFDKSGSFVWRYAELIRQSGGRAIYKHATADRIFYISKVGE